MNKFTSLFWILSFSIAVIFGVRSGVIEIHEPKSLMELHEDLIAGGTISKDEKKPPQLTQSDAFDLLDQIPLTNIRMYTAAREPTDKALNLANQLQQVKAQAADDNVDVSQKRNNSKPRKPMIPPSWWHLLEWDDSEQDGTVREIEYWLWPDDQDFPIGALMDVDLTKGIDGGGEVATVFWRHRKIGAAEWSPVQYDAVSSIRSWPQYKDDTYNVNLNWLNVPGADHYTLEFGRESWGKEFIVKSTPLPEITLMFKWFATGDYDWMVTAKDENNQKIINDVGYTDENGHVGFYNQNGSFTVAPRGFTVVAPPAVSVDQPIKWDAYANATGYNVYVSMSQDYSLPTNNDPWTSDLRLLRRSWPSTELTLRNVPVDVEFFVKIEALMPDQSVVELSPFKISTKDLQVAQ